MVALYDGRYVGNIIGFCPLTNDRQTLCLHQVMATLGSKLIYLFNIVVDFEFQSLGLGRRLLRHFLSLAKVAGYQKVGGHFRGNRSEKNFKILGAQNLGLFEDWFGSAERFTYYELSMETQEGLESVE